MTAPGTPMSCSASTPGVPTPRSSIGPNSCTAATLRAMKYYTVGAKLVKMGVPQTPRSGILNASLRTNSAPSSDMSSTARRLTPASPERPRTSAALPHGGRGTPAASFPQPPPRTAPPRAFTEPGYRPSTAEDLWRTFGMPLEYPQLVDGTPTLPPPTRDGRMSLAEKVVEELGEGDIPEAEEWEAGPAVATPWENDEAEALRAKVDALRARLEAERADHQRTHEMLTHVEAESIVLLRENIELASRFHRAQEEFERGAVVAVTAAQEVQHLRETADRLTRRMNEIERVRWETDALSMDRQIRISNLEKRNEQLDALLKKEERSRERQRATLLSQYRRLRLLAKERAKLRGELERETQRRRRAEVSARATLDRLVPLQEKNLILAYKLMNREHELERAAGDLQRTDAALAEIRSKNALLTKAYGAEKEARLAAQDAAGHTEVRLMELGDRAGDMAARLERELADRRRLEEIEAGLQEEVRMLLAAKGALEAALGERDAALREAAEALEAERGERALAEARCEELEARLRAEEGGRRAEAAERAALRRELDNLLARLHRVMMKYKRCALCALGLHDHDHEPGTEPVLPGDPTPSPGPEHPGAPHSHWHAPGHAHGHGPAPRSPAPPALLLSGGASGASLLSEEVAAAHADILAEFASAKRSGENARAREAHHAALMHAADRAPAGAPGSGSVPGSGLLAPPAFGEGGSSWRSGRGHRPRSRFADRDVYAHDYELAGAEAGVDSPR
eukprot:tig00020934_g16116.t1